MNPKTLTALLCIAGSTYSAAEPTSQPGTEPIPAALAEVEPAVHGWFHFPQKLVPKSSWQLPHSARGHLSLLEMSFNPYRRLVHQDVRLSLEGGPSLAPVAEVIVDEQGREIPGPTERNRFRKGLRQRVVFVFLNPKGLPASPAAKLICKDETLAVVKHSNREARLTLRPTERLEPLGLRKLGTNSEGATRWGLLVRLFSMSELPGVSPRSPRLVEGGWEAQPGHALQIQPDGAVAEISEDTPVPSGNQPFTALFLYDTGQDFHPEKLWIRDELGGHRLRTLPPGAPVDKLRESARRAAMSVDMIHSGVP